MDGRPVVDQSHFTCTLSWPFPTLTRIWRFWQVSRLVPVTVNIRPPLTMKTIILTILVSSFAGLLSKHTKEFMQRILILDWVELFKPHPQEDRFQLKWTKIPKLAPVWTDLSFSVLIGKKTQFPNLGRCDVISSQKLHNNDIKNHPYLFQIILTLHTWTKCNLCKADNLKGRQVGRVERQEGLMSWLYSRIDTGQGRHLGDDRIVCVFVHILSLPHIS